MSFKLNDFEKEFPNFIVKRGYNYFLNGLIIESDYHESTKTYIGIISGTNDYNVKVKMKNTQEVMYATCNCPYHSDCKHITAYLYYLRSKLDNFQKTSDLTFTKKNYFEEIYQNITSFFERNYETYELIKIYNKFKFPLSISLEDNFHQNVFNLFSKLMKEISEELLREMIKTYLTNHYKQNPYHLYEVLKNNIHEEELYYIYNELIFLKLFDYNQLLSSNLFEVFAATFEYTNNLELIIAIYKTDFYKRLIQYYLNIPIKEQKFTVILNFVKERTLNKLKLLELEYNKEQLKTLLKINFQDNITLDLVVYLFENYQILTPPANINYRNEDIVFNLAFIKTFYLEETIEILTKNLLYDKLSKKQIINNLETIYLIDENYNFKENENIYIIALDHGLINNQYSFKMFREGLPIQIREYLKDGDESNIFQKDNHYGTLFYLDELSNKLMFIVIDNNYNIVGKAEITNKKLNFLEKNNYPNYKNAITTLKNSLISNNKNKEFDIFYKKTLEEQEKRAHKKQIEISKKLIKELSLSLFDQPEVILENKVKIELVLAFNEDYEQGYNDKNKRIYHTSHFSFGTKIGNERLYFVKDSTELLDNIQNKTFWKYGKKLAFDHNIKSFDQKSQAIIEILKSYIGIYKIKTNTGLVISDSESFKILKHLKGEKITLYSSFTNYNYLEFLVNEKVFNVEINLSSNELTTNLNHELKDSILIKTSSYDFLLNTNRQKITLVNYSNEKTKTLSDFILSNENFRSDLVIDDILELVLPLVNKEIKLSEDIKLKASSLKVFINSYFDYDSQKDEISVKTKYIRNNLELTIEELKQHQSLVKNYQNILKTFGFNDNKITEQAYIINFLYADLAILKDFGKVFVSENITKMKIKKLNKVQVSVTLDGSILKAAVKSVDLANKDLEKVLKAYKQGKKYIVLNDNVILTSDQSILDLKNFLDLNELTVQDLEKPIEKPIYEVFKLETSAGLDFLMDAKIKKIMDDIINYNDLEYNEPKMYSDLKDYQKSGFKWLKTLAKYNLGGILADDMGLGKTLQVISYLESENFNLSIVVSPKSLIYNWENELIKFGASFKSLVYAGSIEERKALLNQIVNNKEKLLIITSYDTLRNDLESFKDLMFQNIILDEAQAIKTRTALKTKAVKELKGLNKFVLTGTPIENSIFDLWSIFDFIMPGYLYSHNKFNSLGLRVHEEDQNALDFLIKKTQPFILRRVKQDVLKELPEKEETIIYTTFDGENRKIYDSYLLNVQQKLENPNINQLEILSDLMRLRQICISPKLVYDNYQKESLKIEATINIINEAINSNHKVLVFSTFVQALDLLKEQYHEDDYFILTGKTDASERLRMTEAFNNLLSSQKIFFISLKAGGTGLNLTGADIVIHLDPWWNLAAENQATDRAHRIGQENTVNVYKIIMKDSIEERIIELQNKKKDLFDKMIDHNQEITKMSKEDYSFILK